MDTNVNMYGACVLWRHPLLLQQQDFMARSRQQALWTAELEFLEKVVLPEEVCLSSSIYLEELEELGGSVGSETDYSVE